ncbi:UNVERIFIED_CONTAM: hypothetical protein Scaly_2153500 [Sesamum calycinum]|uniref:Uncharacterized protein n=1 Tax=Sesamum calycinum TaxID=2727403 RepID=A0AAW2MLT2_9LAMI
MSEGSADSVIIHIHCLLDGLPSTPSTPIIWRVDSHLRNDKSNNVYDPEILAIGPYHHGISRLQNMEQLKYSYLKRFLKRKNEQSVERYVTAMAAMEKRARKCYADPLDLDGNAFVTMMLFNMTNTNEDTDDDLITLALRFFNGMFLNLSVSRVLTRLPVKNIDHLCGLIHDVWCLPFLETISHKSNERDEWDNINSISGLREAGIKVRKAKRNESLMDIKFVNGVLRIPELIIYDETESQFMNLIAYEQLLPGGEQRYVSDYTFFMHCLINTSKDVKLLRSRGIIENCLGDDDEVRQMFNRLGRNILTSSGFCYSQVFCCVNRHCQRRSEKWNAKLRRNYFNSPWSIISFLAAFTLLVLTFIQTTYTVLTYYTRKG